ncbi:membrane protein [Streptomyces inusitatus]|uniref:Membrane protein n=2 Tax=Streptomyces inusitatus TaxID=68221 RepID=A0A918PZ01_9ACTN|nr:membrane protein [Streptomyces inusitatus]
MLLSIHVLAAILTIGPITVAASIFPRYARAAGAGGEIADDGEERGERAASIAGLLHRICRGYAIAGLAVPVFGVATGARMGILTDAWLLVSTVLTAIAAGVLVLMLLPLQATLLELTAPGAGVGAGADEKRVRPAAARLSGLTGIFNLLWTVVVVLMIFRPGATTGG